MELLEDTIVPEAAREVKQEAREFAAEHIAPNAADYYETGEYPWEILEAGMDAGLVAQDVPEEYGGRGLSLHEVLAIAEEFYRADAGIALTLQLASFGAEIVYEHLAGMATTAEKEGNEYVLNGEKYWIGNGVEADWVTLYAKTGDDENNRYGNYSMFIVPTDTDGYEAEHIPEKMGFRASKQAHIVLDDCRVPAENMVGAEGAGFYMLAEFFNHGRVIVAGHGLGLAAAAIEEASAFVHDRDAFGRSVDEFQAVQHDLAEMRMEFESSRALTWRAADKVVNQDYPGYWAALAKATATESAVFCAERGMQLHGGRSVLTENRISRVYRDVRIPVIYEGANAIQRNLIYNQAPR
jgi:alkylation response protein AidB-like acyl-CoA dehydrogenase